METETKRNRYVPLSNRVAVRVGPVSAAVIRDGNDGDMVLLDRSGLRVLVQWAYDQYGILAHPSYETEAENGGRAVMDAMSEAHNAGVRA